MKQTIRFIEIDFLRFVAALAVMFLHYGVSPYRDHPLPLPFSTLGPMVKYNYLGVNLFFMISGFVILMSVQGKNLQDFFISRVVRLFPAYWVCCTLTFVVILVFARDQIYTSLPRYLLNMTMLNGFVNIGGIDAVYWTLYIELKFYLLVGVLVATRQIPSIQYYLGLWLGVSVLHLAWPSSGLSYLLIPEYSAYFIAGSVFYLIHKEGFSRYRVFLLAASFLVAIANDATILTEKSVWYHMAFSIPVLIGIIATFYLVFLLIALKNNATSRWDRVFVFLGSISYPLYLLHHNIGMAIFQNLYTHVNCYVLLIGTAIAMICLARLIHVFVERRYSPIFKNALQKQFSRWRGKPESARV